MKLGLKSYQPKQLIGMIIGIVSFALIFFLKPIDGLSVEGNTVLATLLLMTCLWISEALDSGITGLIPLIIFPLTQVMTPGATAASYGNTTIFMFFGGFAISIALERWNLHNRIALSIIKVIGTSMNRILIGLMIAGGFLSMWVSNTATILMLLPIATAVANKIIELMKTEEGYQESDGSKFRISSIFAVGFGAIIGGSTTLIGTPTNLLLGGFATELLGINLSFSSFMLFMLPISVIQYIVVYFAITKIFYRINKKYKLQVDEVIQKELDDLGKMSYEEKVVMLIFLVTVFFWMTRTYLFADLKGLGDMGISIISCVLFFLIPNKSGGRILETKDISKIPWSVVLMLMGGMAIAAGFTQTDLVTYLGELMLIFNTDSTLMLVIITTITGLLITQVAPNTATGTILIPLAATLAQTIGMNPVVLMVAAALSTGFATTLPHGTPVMGIMYGAGDVRVTDLLKVGGVLALVSGLLIVIFAYLVAPILLV